MCRSPGVLLQPVVVPDLLGRLLADEEVARAPHHLQEVGVRVVAGGQALDVEQQVVVVSEPAVPVAGASGAALEVPARRSPSVAFRHASAPSGQLGGAAPELVQHRRDGGPALVAHPLEGDPERVAVAVSAGCTHCTRPGRLERSACRGRRTSTVDPFLGRGRLARRTSTRAPSRLRSVR